MVDSCAQPEHRCRHPFEPCMPCEEITRAQLRIIRRPVPLRTRADYRRAARWYELEARRGYASSAETLCDAANMRWAAELAGIHGPGTWSELLEAANA